MAKEFVVRGRIRSFGHSGGGDFWLTLDSAEMPHNLIPGLSRENHGQPPATITIRIEESAVGAEAREAIAGLPTGWTED